MKIVKKYNDIIVIETNTSIVLYDCAVELDRPSEVAPLGHTPDALVDAYLAHLMDAGHTRYYTAQMDVTMRRLCLPDIRALVAAGRRCRMRISYSTLLRIVAGQHRRDPGTALKLREMCKELEKQEKKQ